MVGFHTTKYTTLQAQYLSSFMTMFFALHYYFTHWNYSFGKILGKLLLIVLLPLNVVVAFSMFILYCLGYVFNLIPVIRDILLFLFVLLYGGLTSFLFMAMNSYDFHNYVEAAEEFNLSHKY